MCISQSELYLVILTLIVFVLYVRGTLRFVYLVSKIQGPSLWELMSVRTRKLMSKMLRANFCEMCEYYSYEPWAFWTMSGDFVVVLSDVESISEVYKNKNLNLKPDFMYGAMADYIGEGSLALRDAEKWRVHRKVINPAFQKSLLESNMGAITKGADKIIEEFRKNANGADFDFGNILDTGFLETTASFLLSDGYTVPDLPGLTKVMMQASKQIHSKTVNPVRHWFRLRFHKETRKMEKEIRSHFGELKKSLMEYVNRVASEIRGKREPQSALEHCLKYMNKTGITFAEDEIFDECLTIAAAGTETTRTATKMAIMLLALHQEVQQRVFDELEGIFGDSDLPPTPQDLDRMQYLGMVIKETLRLYPAGSMISRKTSEETNVNGTIIPKGACVMIMITALHRNPDNFKDPLEFIPERFLPELSQNRHPHSYIPFSSGIRNCVGKPQAIMMMKIILSNIFRRYKVFPGTGINSVDDIKIHFVVTLDVRNPVVKLVSRK